MTDPLPSLDELHRRAEADGLRAVVGALIRDDRGRDEGLVRRLVELALDGA